MLIELFYIIIFLVILYFLTKSSNKEYFINTLNYELSNYINNLNLQINFNCNHRIKQFNKGRDYNKCCFIDRNKPCLKNYLINQ